MNERILELAIEAKKYAETKPDIYQVAYDKKFAESIVKECARIARATPCPYEEDELRQRLGHTWDMASIEAGRGIVKHFGVEE